MKDSNNDKIEQKVDIEAIHILIWRGQIQLTFLYIEDEGPLKVYGY